MFAFCTSHLKLILSRWIKHKDASVPSYVLGQWVENNPAGTRSTFIPPRCEYNPHIILGDRATMVCRCDQDDQISVILEPEDSDRGPQCISDVRDHSVHSHIGPEIGEVWAYILHNVYAALVSAHHGFSRISTTAH